MKLTLAGLLASLSLLAQPATASAEVDGEQLVREFLEGVSTMIARFEQSLVDADGNVVEESSGRLEIARPGRFRWSYEEPYEQLLVADGLNVWSYDADLEQVTVKPQQDVLGSTPALLLGGAEDALDGFEVTESFIDRGTSWVRLRPRGEGSGFESVDLGFTDGRLSRMIFVDTLGQSTLIALFDVDTDTAIDPARFAFEPPDTADVVGTPLGRTER